METNFCRNERTLEEIVERSPLQVTPNTLVVEAIDLMSQTEDRSCILVADGGKLVGIFTERDLVKAVASAIDLSKTRIDRVMAQPVISLTLNNSAKVLTALSLMRSSKIHHLPVLDKEGQLVGLVTQDRIYEAICQSVESKQNEAELRLSEERRKLALDLTETASWDWNLITGEPIWSDNMFDLFGLSREETSPSYEIWRDRVYPEDLERMEATLAHCLQNRILFKEEYRFVYPDGSIHWHLAKGRAIYDADDRAVRMVGITLDISDRKQLEADIQKSEEQLRLALDLNHIGMWDWNVATGEATWNDYNYRLLGYQPGEVEPSYQLWHSHIHPDDLADLDQKIDRSLKTQTDYKAEFRVILPDGSIRWHLGRGRTLYDESGQAVRMIGVAFDITESKQADIALRESEAKFRHFAENSHAVVWIAEADALNNLYVNPAYEKIWGQSRQTLSERPASWLEFIHPDDRSHVRRTLEQQRQGKIGNLEYRIVRPDGSVRWIWDWGFAIRDEEGQIYRYGGIAEDITERKEMEARLREREEFLSSIYNNVEQAVFVIEVTAIGEFHYLACNRLSEIYTGVTEEKIRGKTPEEAFGPVIGRTFQENYARCWQAGRSISYEEQLFFENYTISTLTTLSPLRNQEGQIDRIVGTAIDISDRKHSERALLELSTALEYAVQGISRLDDRGLYLSANKAYTNTVGYSQSELIGMPWKHTVYPEDVAKLQAAYQSMLANGKVEVEARGIRKDGSLFYKQLAMIAVYDERGAFNGHYCLMKDISDRKATEIALRQSEERYRTLFNSIDEGFFIIETLFDANGKASDFRFLETNPAFEKLTGLQNVKGKTMQEISSNVEENWYEILGRVALTGEPVRLIREAKALPDKKWFEIYAFQFNREEKQKVALLFSEITDRKLAEEKIAEQAALIDIATDAIFVRDLDNRILFWSQGAERLYGWTAEEALGKIASNLFQSEFLQQESASQIEEILNHCLQQGLWQGEIKHIAKSGQSIIVASRWTLVRDESGQPKSILVVNTDITEKKRIEEQFYHAQRLESIGTLASGIAHDFNNLLTPILAVSQLLPLKFPNLDDQTRQLLATVEDSAKRGANLVKQVLSFSRGTEGKRVIIQMRHLLEELVSVAQRTFPKSIEIFQDIPKRELGLIWADSTQIHQVFMNILVNARDAMPHGGHLTISAENLYLDENYVRMNWEARVGSYIAIAISDTGTGIPPELMERIFDPFFTTKEVGRGTGLGLATVSGIVKNHGGFINVYSEVGKGTQFKVFLPAIKGTVSKSNLEKELPKGKGELILIVDDEQSIREITKTSLENYNYRTLVASDGIEAISTYAERKEEISLVLMDLMMPNLDGLTAIQALQKMNPQVKVIATSGLPASYQQALAANIKTFLLKPYTIEKLLKALNKELSKDEG